MKYLYNGKELRGNLIYSDWIKIGYKVAAKNVVDGFDYAKEIKDNWDSSISDLSNKFEGDKKLIFFPFVDTSSVTNMSYAFYDSNLTTIPEGLDFGNVTDMSYAFAGRAFSDYPLITIPPLNTEKVSDFTQCFSGCTKLKRIEGISFKSVGTETDRIFGNVANYTTGGLYILIKDIGTNPDCIDLDFWAASGWGINSEDVPDARQSLIDSLLTYSFDRRAAGYSDCTIELYPDVYNVLTTEEISAINAKGYILNYEDL